MNTGLTFLVLCMCVFKSTHTSYPKSMSQMRRSQVSMPELYLQMQTPLGLHTE